MDITISIYSNRWHLAHGSIWNIHAIQRPIFRWEQLLVRYVWPRTVASWGHGQSEGLLKVSCSRTRRCTGMSCLVGVAVVMLPLFLWLSWGMVWGKRREFGGKMKSSGRGWPAILLVQCPPIILSKIHDIEVAHLVLTIWPTTTTTTTTTTQSHTITLVQYQALFVFFCQSWIIPELEMWTYQYEVCLVNDFVRVQSSAKVLHFWC